jgi:hypothetical protein
MERVLCVKNGGLYAPPPHKNRTSIDIVAYHVIQDVQFVSYCK